MLTMDLKGKKAFVVGVSDDKGFGWAIAKALAEAGADLLIGSWVPTAKLFLSGWDLGKFDASRTLRDGTLMHFSRLYPIDARFDTPEDVPEEIRSHKRYQGHEGYTLSEVAEAIGQEFGGFDYLVHSLANSPEIQSPLLETSRKGYLETINASSYSLIGLLQACGPLMNRGGGVLSLSYIASERVIPGYGGGMSSAKAALESDTRTLAWEAGRKWGIRVNALSPGPWASRAATAIGFIGPIIDYNCQNGPLQERLAASEVGNVAVFLLSPLASAVTGTVLYVDKGMHAMGVAVDSRSLHPDGQ